MENTIKNKKGFIKFHRETLINLTPDEFKALYSVFFPIKMEADYANEPNVMIKAYGYSEQFEELTPGDAPLEYAVTLEAPYDQSIEVSITPIEELNQYLHTVAKY